MVSFGRNYELMKMCFGVLRKDKEILWFPVMAGVLLCIVVLLFVFSFFAYPAFFVELIVLAILVIPVLAVFLGVFFEAAVVGCATIRLRGGDPRIRDGLRIASENSWPLLQWAIIIVIVGVALAIVRAILNKLTGKSRGFAFPTGLSQLCRASVDPQLSIRSMNESRVGIGDIVAGGLGIAWSAATFFVIPVILYEELSSFEAIKRSGEIIKSVWGETLILSLGIGVVFVFIGMLGGLGLIFIGAAVGSGAIGIVVAVAYWVALACLYFALNGVLRAALYEVSEIDEQREVEVQSSHSKEFDSLLKFVNSFR